MELKSEEFSFHELLDQISVIVGGQCEDKGLTFVCNRNEPIDEYFVGDALRLRQVVINILGNAVKFTDAPGTVTFTVEPETQYRVSVEISGFHRLMGTTSDSYTTISREEILTFTGICGNEDGSVILSFTTKGDAQTAWRVYYSTPGEQELSKEFTGNLIPITGLTPGKTYDFRLEPVANIYIIGTDTFQYTASKLILAQNLAIHGFDDGQLMVTWDAPEGAEVKTWYVRCYNDAGDVKELTVNETQVAIPGLNVADGYTVEVTAEGMTVNQRTFISAGSITFKEIMVDDTEPGQLTVTWEFEGADPADGWLVLYTIDGGEAQVLQCTTNEAVISGLIPGTHYDITIQPRTGVTVFGGTTSYDVAGGEPFEGYGIKGTDLTFRMCWTPSNPGWNSVYLYETDFTNVFASGELASFVILDKKDSQNSEDDLMILMVIRDSAGNPIGYKIVNTVWKTMFADKQGELDIPADIMPTVSGEYTVDIYFNSAFVTTVAFRIK
jgi:hypothetical protein